MRQLGKRMDQDVVERHQRGLRHAPVAAQVAVARRGCTRIRWRVDSADIAVTARAIPGWSHGAPLVWLDPMGW